MTKKGSTAKKTSIIPMDELKKVNGHMVGGELTSIVNGVIISVYAYTTPTYDVLKKEKYWDTLIAAASSLY